MFRIKHHWLRYEFAPSRGQIHAHMLVICDRKYIETLEKCVSENPLHRAEILSQWVKRSFSMTAMLNEKFIDTVSVSDSEHPSSVFFGDVSDKEKDQYYCQITLQQHYCSSYCLKRSKINGKGRWCNKTCSHEKTPGCGDTPGFRIIDEASVTNDLRGYMKLELPRNHPRIVQTSIFLLQGWRANVDIQLLLYEGDMQSTSTSEISQISDYIISYICKGTETSVQEKYRMRDVILNSTDCTGDINDVKRVSRHLLNEVTKHRVISKQETMCYIGRLSLFDCSELIENVSVSGYYRLGSNRAYSTCFLTKYARRSSCLDKSMHEYFDIVKNQNSIRPLAIIPNYVGLRIDNLYPITGSQAKSLLMIYKPWIGVVPYKDDSDANLIRQFENFVTTAGCPLSLRNAYNCARYTRRYDLKEPVSTFYPSSLLVDEATQFDQDAEDIFNLTSSLPCHFSDTHLGLSMQYDIGQNYDWSKQTYVVSLLFA